MTASSPPRPTAAGALARFAAAAVFLYTAAHIVAPGYAALLPLALGIVWHPILAAALLRRAWLAAAGKTAADMREAWLAAILLSAMAYAAILQAVPAAAAVHRLRNPFVDQAAVPPATDAAWHLVAIVSAVGMPAAAVVAAWCAFHIARLARALARRRPFAAAGLTAAALAALAIYGWQAVMADPARLQGSLAGLP